MKIFSPQAQYAKQVQHIEIANLIHIVDGDKKEDEYPVIEKVNLSLMIRLTITFILFVAAAHCFGTPACWYLIIAALLSNLLLVRDSQKAKKILENTCWHENDLQGWRTVFWLLLLVLIGYTVFFIMPQSTSL